MIDPSDAALRQMFSAALSSGGAWAELFTERTTVTELTCTTKSGLTAARSRIQGVGLRVGLGRDTALVYSTDYDHASLVELGSTAAAVFRAIHGRGPAERTPAVRIGRTGLGGHAAKTDWQSRLQVDVALVGPSATGTCSPGSFRSRQ